MSSVLDRIDPERAWLAAVLSLAVALVAGSLAFPRRVYDGFVWRYFWGPVYADAHSGACATRHDGVSEIHYDADYCATAAEPVAEPGYTLVSEVGYAILVLTALVGLAFLLRRLEIERYRALFFGLFPFMFFGGALRVVEDVNARVFRLEEEWIISYPLSSLFISPLIYVTVAAVALTALVVSLYLARNDYVEYGFEYPLAGFGVFAGLVTLGLLGYMAATAEVVSFYPAILVTVVVVATTVTGVVWWLIERFAPHLNEGTGYMGLAVLFGQAVDGVANVVGLDWMVVLGAPDVLSPKHPANRLVVSLSESYLPESVLAVTGAAWPFLVIKILAAVMIIWIFNEEVIEDSPRFSVMLLIGAVAVGLGPGTRDLIRSTLFV